MAECQHLREEEALDSFKRGQIYGYILANPGAHYHRMVKALDINPGSIQHHLNVLKKFGYISAYKDGIYKRYTADRDNMPHLKTKKERFKKKIRGIVKNNLGISKSKIAQRLELKISTVVNYLDEMESEGVLEIRKIPIKRMWRTECYLI